MKRYPLPDLLKGFAVFLIIPVHILEKFVDYPGRESLFGKTLLLLGGPLAVPVFMMVMGYFVAMSKKSTLQNMGRGVLIFFAGLILNIGLNFHLLLKIGLKGWKLDPLQSIFSIDIFYLAGISIIILSLLKNIGKGQQLITLVLILFVSTTVAYFNNILLVTDRNYILPFIGGEYSWSYFPLFPWLTYPLIGFLFQKREAGIRKFVQLHRAISIAALFVIFTLVAIFSKFGIESTINLSSYYHHGFAFILWALGVDILWITGAWFVIAKFHDAPPITFLSWLGKNITVFYIVQWLIIGNIATAIFQTQELSKFGYWFGSIFLVTLGLVFLYQRTKVLIQSKIISMKIGLIFLLFYTLSCTKDIRTAPFQVAIEPLKISGLKGLQSFAFGQHDGKWLLIGGRSDGLHRRQPWATFDSEGQNKQLVVIDPVEKLTWSAPLSSLPVSIQEQLSSTNMEFHQSGDFLYIAGGYGYSNSADDHMTYPYLTAVNVPGVVHSIVNNASITSFFRQINDEQFAVTGGYLNKIYDTYYLTGGQWFDGRYNPMGHASYTQKYTNSIRKFTLIDFGSDLNISHFPVITDSLNLHRRDYNVIPQIMPDGKEGLTAFSGVFQIGVDLPYMNCVNITESGYYVNNDFSQFYSQYHCAHIPLFSASENEMHNLFFGGIAQYSDSAGILIQDDNVPFVKTISRVTRDTHGRMAEYKLPGEMPGYLGAGAEFIPVENIRVYGNGVIKLDKLVADSTLVGYIVGGIESPESNIFWTNNGTQSSANHQIYKVFIIKSKSSEVHILNARSIIHSSSDSLKSDNPK